MKDWKQILRYFLLGAWIVFLTIWTQIGGVVWLISWLTCQFLMRQFNSIDIWQHRWVRWTCLWAVFMLFYSMAVFGIVPTLAARNGKMRLPDIGENPHLKPATSLSRWLNRSYVDKDLYELALQVSQQFGETYAGATVTYLDASFPLFNYPLFPHRTHRGKQLDIAFCYLDAQTNRPVNDIPSATGYGIFEPPKIGEPNTCDFCKKENPDYDINRYFAWFSTANQLRFDLNRTKTLCMLFAKRNTIGKIYIEPHLEQRLGLASFGKVRFHGCAAARHDDHFHVEVY